MCCLCYAIFNTCLLLTCMLQHKEDSRDLAHKIAKEFDAEYWETSSKTGRVHDVVKSL